MRSMLVIGFALGMLLAGPAPAQEGETTRSRRVEVRITSSGKGTLVTIDRGEVDGLESGDVVTFHPLDQRPVQGTVVRVFERFSTVDVLGTEVIPAPGTRGVVRVPVQRARGEPTPRRGEVRETPEHLPWENADEGWTPDLPLLTPMENLRPEQRSALVTGRVWWIGDATLTDDANRNDVFLRTGTEVAVENPLSRGGTFELETEVDYRRAEVPDVSGGGGESEGNLRIERMSYARGGTRYRPVRWEVGRFLQRGMPEFGVVDGAEWSYRRANGHRFGFSLGGMPRPDADFRTQGDAQAALFYTFVDDAAEELSVSAGYQKSFHHGDADRDLVAASFHYQPPSAWDAHASLWVDYYTAGERFKDAGFELTQVLATAGRSLSRGGRVDFSYRRQRFPDMDRTEFQPLDPREVVDLRSDRVAVSFWRPVGADERWHARAGVFDEQTDSGGDLEAGMSFDDVVLRSTTTDVSLYNTKGTFAHEMGLRASVQRVVEGGSWDAFYELSNHDIDRFPSNEDDVLHHRLRGGREWQIGADWFASVYAEARTWDDAFSWSIGFYVQRSF